MKGFDYPSTSELPDETQPTASPSSGIVPACGPGQVLTRADPSRPYDKDHTKMPWRVTYTKGSGIPSLVSLETFQSHHAVELTVHHLLHHGAVFEASLPDGTHVTIEPNKEV